MEKKGWSISVKLWIYTTLLILGVMGALISVISWRFSDFYLQQKLDSLSEETTGIANQLSALPTWPERYARLETLQLATGSQLVLLSSDGEVLLSAGQLNGVGSLQPNDWFFQGNMTGDTDNSGQNPNLSGGMLGGWSGWLRGPRVTDFFTSDNLAEVLSGKVMSIRAVPKTKLSSSPAMLIAACPIGSPAVGAVLLGTSTSSAQESINAFNRIITYTGLIAVGLAVLISLFFSRQWTRPLALMQKGASRMAQGDFEPIEGVTSKDELGELAEALNQMGANLRDHMEWLSQEKNLLQGIIESISDAVIMLGVDGSLVYANDPAKLLWTDGEVVSEERKNEILGFLRSQAEQQRESSEQSEEQKKQGEAPAKGQEKQKEQGAMPTERQKEQNETSQPDAGAVDLADALEASDQEEAPQLSTLVLGSQILAVAMEPMSRSESVPGFVAVLRDVTASLRAEKERRDLLASVTHELRTPLHLVQGYLEAIQDRVIPPEKYDEHINLVLEETGRLTRLVQDLQDLNRLEKGTGLKFEDIRLDEFMEDVEHRFRRRAEELDLTLTVEKKAGHLWADRDKLLQIFINLLDNAFRHTPAGEKVQVGITEKDDEYLIAVQDEGEGIPEESVGHVFDRFYRVDKARSRKDGGMGLGLAIVKQIAEAHGGSVHVTSKVGQGTTFFVRLPQYKPEEQTEANGEG